MWLYTYYFLGLQHHRLYGKKWVGSLSNEGSCGTIIQIVKLNRYVKILLLPNRVC